MAKLTKEQWAYLEKSYGQYSPIYLMCDGYKVTLMVFVSVEKSKVIHLVLVNGFFLGKWLNKEENHPESKFMCVVQKTHKMVSDKEFNKMKRECGAKFAQKFAPSKYSYLTPYFSSFKAFKAHIIANCETIEIYQYEE